MIVFLQAPTFQILNLSMVQRLSAWKWGPTRTSWMLMWWTQVLRVYTTHFWWNLGWFIIELTTFFCLGFGKAERQCCPAMAKPSNFSKAPFSNSESLLVPDQFNLSLRCDRLGAAVASQRWRLGGLSSLPGTQSPQASSTHFRHLRHRHPNDSNISKSCQILKKDHREPHPETSQDVFVKKRCYKVKANKGK